MTYIRQLDTPSNMNRHAEARYSLRLMLIPGEMCASKSFAASAKQHENMKSGAGTVPGVV